MAEETKNPEVQEEAAVAAPKVEHATKTGIIQAITPNIRLAKS